jgi:transcriptional regulator with XRE-family HTH domain
MSLVTPAVTALSSVFQRVITTQRSSRRNIPNVTENRLPTQAAPVSITFIKQWREYRDLTQDELAERLETSKASISRIENGEQAYTQDFLEACADALRTDPASLLMRDPTDDEAVWSLWDKAKVGERQMIESIVRSVVKTGTK